MKDFSSSDARVVYDMPVGVAHVTVFGEKKHAPFVVNVARSIETAGHDVLGVRGAIGPNFEVTYQIHFRRARVEEPADLFA